VIRRHNVGLKKISKVEVRETAEEEKKNKEAFERNIQEKARTGEKGGGLPLNKKKAI